MLTIRQFSFVYSSGVILGVGKDGKIQLYIIIGLPCYRVLKMGVYFWVLGYEPIQVVFWLRQIRRLSHHLQKCHFVCNFWKLDKRLWEVPKKLTHLYPWFNISHIRFSEYVFSLSSFPLCHCFNVIETISGFSPIQWIEFNI